MRLICLLLSFNFKPEIRDEWIDSIDWQTIKERESKPSEQNEEDSDSEPEALDLKHIYGYLHNICIVFDLDYHRNNLSLIKMTLYNTMPCL